jgi:hypothetical protein
MRGCRLPSSEPRSKGKIPGYGRGRPHAEGVELVGHEGFEKIVIVLGAIVLVAAVIVAIVQFLL